MNKTIDWTDVKPQRRRRLATGDSSPASHGTGDDPDVVAESHAHWAVGYLDGFPIRVYGKDGGITDGFREFCGIKEKLDDYPILNEADYSEREYETTLENYGSEMRMRLHLRREPP
jgi:hypothetical protein